MRFGSGYEASVDAFARAVADHEPSPGAELARLIVIPALIGVLFFGGVYWFRLQLAASGGAPETTAFVQVHLLPRPDPIPIPVAPVTQPAALSIPNPTSGRTEAPAATPNQVLAALPSEEPTAADPVTSSMSQPSTVDTTADAATLEFRNELLRHIARFQRYPRAAERRHLQGTVRAVFSVNREGRVLGAFIKTSSGQTVLDQAAIDTIRRAQPMPTIPAALPDSLSVEVALGFDPS
jgi:periplasmic protein TonB